MELGVGVSLGCGPKEEEGLIITPGNLTNTFTQFELGFSAGFVQSIDFLEGDLEFVTPGMPKRISSTLCLKCFSNRENDILGLCSARSVRYYEPGELRVGVKTTKGSFGTVSEGFQETSGQGDFRGTGDLTSNGMHAAIYSFTEPDPSKKKVLTLFEYGDQEHITHLLTRARKKNGRPVWQPTAGPVRVTEISCQVNKLSARHFRQAVMAYRTVQLENPAFPATFDDTEKQFGAITEDDVYRAVLSMKIMEDTRDAGKFFEYTTCGQYDWRFMAPILVVILLVILLGLFSMHLSSSVNIPRVPSNSKGWYHHTTRLPMERSRMDKPEHSGYFESIYDEMMLVPDDRGSGAPLVVFQSRLSNSRGNAQDGGRHDPESSLPQELYEVQMSRLYYQSDSQTQGYSWS